MGDVVAVVNMKGGVGKTTTLFHLAGALAASGKRILLVDADPQASLSRAFYGPNRVEAIPPGESVAALFEGRRLMPSQLIRPTDYPGIELIAGSEAATNYNDPYPKSSPAQRQGMRTLLDRVRDGYDLVMLDCPPNLQTISLASLIAADAALVPVIPDKPGVEGIRDLAKALAVVQPENPKLALLGYLLTQTAREAVQTIVSDMLRETYGDLVFASSIPRAAQFKEGFAAHEPVEKYAPKSKSAAAIRAVGHEVVTRLERSRSAADIVGTISGVA